MTTDPLALVAAMPMPEPLAEAMCVPAHAAYTADQYRAARLEAAQLVLAQGGDALHAAIMNIQQRLDVAIEHPTQYEAAAYAKGHRDARHAAAELALGGAVLAQGEPVAGPPYSLDTMDPALRGLIVSAVHGAIATNDVPPAGHWLTSSWQMGQGIRAEMARSSAPAAPVNDEVLDALRLVSMSAGWRYMTHETRAIVQAALDNARAAIASAEAAAKGAA